MQHQARKRFGQNFLTDDTIIGRIVDAISAQPGQLVLEIGPGQAALTCPLADSGAELHLLEIDRDLVARLNVQFATRENVTVHSTDALRTDFAEITGGRPFRLVGNLPYNISTPLLFHVLQWSELVTDMHFMLQQEVVKRMAADTRRQSLGQVVADVPVPLRSHTPVQRPAAGIFAVTQSAVRHRSPGAAPRTAGSDRRYGCLRTTGKPGVFPAPQDPAQQFARDDRRH